MEDIFYLEGKYEICCVWALLEMQTELNVNLCEHFSPQHFVYCCSVLWFSRSFSVVFKLTISQTEIWSQQMFIISVVCLLLQP